MQLVYLVWSLITLVIWLIIYLAKNNVRKEMLRISLWTMPLGLSEPLFVPKYWNPPSLLDLAQKSGFDIESLIFSFAIGGIGMVLYRVIIPAQLHRISAEEKTSHNHRLHRYILFSPPIIFLFFFFFTNLNHIYCAVIAMFAGALTTLYCRPDLKYKIWIGGFSFTVLYFIFFTSLNIFYPDYVRHVWNFVEISGILIVGIPLEEYLFAFSFGLYWSGLYEHIHWLGINKIIIALKS